MTAPCSSAFGERPGGESTAFHSGLPSHRLPFKLTDPANFRQKPGPVRVQPRETDRGQAEDEPARLLAEYKVRLKDIRVIRAGYPPPFPPRGLPSPHYGFAWEAWWRAVEFQRLLLKDEDVKTPLNVPAVGNKESANAIPPKADEPLPDHQLGLFD